MRLKWWKPKPTSIPNPRLDYEVLVQHFGSHRAANDAICSSFLKGTPITLPEGFTLEYVHGYFYTHRKGLIYALIHFPEEFTREEILRLMEILSSNA